MAGNSRWAETFEQWRKAGSHLDPSSIPVSDVDEVIKVEEPARPPTAQQLRDEERRQQDELAGAVWRMTVNANFG